MFGFRSSRRARCEISAALAALIEGHSPPRLVFYDGEMPASADEPVDQEILACLYLRTPAFWVDGDGALTACPIDPRRGLIAGMPTWARFLDGDGNAVFDVDVGLPHTDAALILDRPVSVQGPVEITDLTIRFF
jgi:hypothetical protein